MLHQLSIIAPEIMLFTLALFGQIWAVFSHKHCLIFKFVCLLAVMIIYYLFNHLQIEATIFTASFFTSPILAFLKGSILALTMMSLLIYYGQTQISHHPLQMEFITLILLATLGIFISISANNLLLLFCGLELQALTSYALASFNIEDSKSSEAGLKYFILGALISCLMLFGISFIYGFTGTIEFTKLALITDNRLNIGLLAGLILLMAGIFFKLSAAPLHLWTPDIYEGAPIAVVAFFGTAQKLGILIVLINILNQLIINYPPLSTNLVKIIAICSMLVGAFGALGQTSLKRLMGYGTILNIGYVLIAIALNDSEYQYLALIYLLIYSLALIGFFACLVAMLGTKSENASFNDLSAVAKHKKLLAAAMTMIIFSMIGLPPLAGFFAKYFIFYQSIQQGEFILPVIGVLTSVIAAFYYLKIVKYIYFVSSERKINIIPDNNSLFLLVILTSSCLVFSFIFLRL